MVNLSREPPLRYRARAVTTAMVKELVSTCGADLLGHRDRALILTGFASALRRSELAALDITDLEFGAEGVRITVRRSKTDQEAEGAVVGVHATHSASCPIAALRRWIDAAGITSGRVFRRLDRGQVGAEMSGEAVAMVVQRRARLAGIDTVGLSAHSLRSGLATSAAAAGLSEADIQRQTRHQSVTVLRTYIRHGSAFIKNVSAGIGL